MFRILVGIVMVASLIAGDSYRDSIIAWQNHREQGLRSGTGWLALVGLFWLDPHGKNTVGSDLSNSFVLANSSAPARIGRLRRATNAVFFTNLGGHAVTVNDHPITGETKLSYDPEKPDIVKSGSVQFFVIQRGDKLGLRVKDSQSPALKKFVGTKFFPINPSFRFDAKFIKDETKVSILNMLGQTELQPSPGLVEFTYKGQAFRMRALVEDDTLFFVFKDPTSRTTTYQVGRMLNVPMPKNGRVDLDFNKSYNPPCTFTNYATCPIPPKENRLPFPVQAGELRYGSGHPE